LFHICFIYCAGILPIKFYDDCKAASSPECTSFEKTIVQQGNA